MGPIEKMVQDIIEKKLKEDFPQVQLPAALTARVTKASILGTTYDYDELKITDKDTPRVFNAKITGKWFEYSLKILTRDGGIDTRFPEIPGVRSKVQIPAGGTAAVVLLYGELRPYIVGEVK